MFIDREVREWADMVSAHFPDRSARWLLRQREHLITLLGLVAEDLLEALDFRRVRHLNRSFISEELRSQESDMIFSIPFRSPDETGKEVIIYILIEHQSTVDRLMGLRLLSYMTQIWMEERRQWQDAEAPKAKHPLTPIIPIVFHTGSQRWQVPLSLTALMDIPEGLSRFVPTFDTLLFDVKATPPELLTQRGRTLGWLLTVLQQEQADSPILQQALKNALDGIRHLRTDDPEQYTSAIVYLFYFILHRGKAEDHQDLLQVLVEENAQNKEIVDMAESIMELTRQQGIEQGARQTSIESTLRILRAHFPDADVDALKPILEAVQDFNQLEALNLEASLVATFSDFQQRLET